MITATAETIIDKKAFKGIKVILTELMFLGGVVPKAENPFVVHYLEKDEEPLAYKHPTEQRAKDDFEHLSKIAKAEARGEKR